MKRVRWIGLDILRLQDINRHNEQTYYNHHDNNNRDNTDTMKRSQYVIILMFIKPMMVIMTEIRNTYIH